jgi:hypothetical protein
MNGCRLPNGLEGRVHCGRHPVRSDDGVGLLVDRLTDQLRGVNAKIVVVLRPEPDDLAALSLDDLAGVFSAALDDRPERIVRFAADDEDLGAVGHGDASATRQCGRGDHDLHHFLEKRHARFLQIAARRRLHDSSRRRVEPVADRATDDWSGGQDLRNLRPTRDSVPCVDLADITALVLHPPYHGDILISICYADFASLSQKDLVKDDTLCQKTARPIAARLSLTSLLPRRLASPQLTAF